MSAGARFKTLAVYCELTKVKTLAAKNPQSSAVEYRPTHSNVSNVQQTTTHGHEHASETIDCPSMDGLFSLCHNKVMNIIKAELSDLTEVARLFDLYRQFYDCPADLTLATQFIKARMDNAESDIFIAKETDVSHGFVQLYPSFCSVQAIKIFILYDLFVEVDYRNTGLGEKLMNKAKEWAKQNGAERLDLLTARTNHIGQHLYEKLGYKKVLEDFHAYSLEL